MKNIGFDSFEQFLDYYATSIVQSTVRAGNIISIHFKDNSSVTVYLDKNKRRIEKVTEDFIGEGARIFKNNVSDKSLPYLLKKAGRPLGEKVISKDSLKETTIHNSSGNVNVTVSDIINFKDLPREMQNFLVKEVDSMRTHAFGEVIAQKGRKAIASMAVSFMNGQKFIINSYGVDRSYNIDPWTIDRGTYKENIMKKRIKLSKDTLIEGDIIKEGKYVELEEEIAFIDGNEIKTGNMYNEPDLTLDNNLKVIPAKDMVYDQDDQLVDSEEASPVPNGGKPVSIDVSVGSDNVGTAPYMGQDMQDPKIGQAEQPISSSSFKEPTSVVEDGEAMAMPSEDDVAIASYGDGYNDMEEEEYYDLDNEMYYESSAFSPQEIAEATNIRVTFEDKSIVETKVMSTFEKAKAYFLENYFTIDEELVKAIDVHEIKEGEKSKTIKEEYAEWEKKDKIVEAVDNRFAAYLTNNQDSFTIEFSDMKSYKDGMKDAKEYYMSKYGSDDFWIDDIDVTRGPLSDVSVDWRMLIGAKGQVDEKLLDLVSEDKDMAMKMQALSDHGFDITEDNLERVSVYDAGNERWVEGNHRIQLPEDWLYDQADSMGYLKQKFIEDNWSYFEEGFARMFSDDDPNGVTTYSKYGDYLIMVDPS